MRQTLVWTHVHVDVYNMADVSETNSGSSQPNNPLSRKLNKVLETRLDNDKVWNSRDTFKQLIIVCRVQRIQHKSTKWVSANALKRTNTKRLYRSGSFVSFLWLQYCVKSRPFHRPKCMQNNRPRSNPINTYFQVENVIFSRDTSTFIHTVVSTPGCQLWPIKGAFALCPVQSGAEPYSCQNGPDCCLHCTRQSRVLSDWICQIYIVNSSKWHDWFFRLHIRVLS